MKYRAIWYLIPTLFLLSSCAHYAMVPANQPISVGKAFFIQPPNNWSKQTKTDGNLEIWTVDGPQLERLMIFAGIEDGQPLVKNNGHDNKDLPVFDSNMSPLEIAELTEATLLRMGAHNVTTTHLKPAPFDALDGFRFDFSFMSKEGLNYKGFMVGTVKEKKLLAIAYIGTEICYFERYAPEVEEMLQTITVL